MRYILIICLFIINSSADDVKLYKSLNKTLLVKDKKHKDEKINKIHIKSGNEDNITKKIQALMRKKR